MNARIPLAALLASLLLAAPLAAQAPRPGGGKAASEEARTRYERGLQLFDEGAYEAALIEFQRANELSPSYKIFYNIAKVNRQINDYAGALRAYERYLTEGGKEITGARRAEVDKEVSQMRARVATLQISANAPDADISVDDISVGKTPVSVVVNAGRRKVTAARSGRLPATKVVTVAGADTLKVELELVEPTPVAPITSAPPMPLATSPGTTPPPPPPASTSSVSPPESSSFPTVGWVATGVFAVGATVTGVLALSASSTLKSDRDSATATRSSLDDDHSKQRTLALVSDILTGATLIAGGVSLYLTLKPGKTETGALVHRVDVAVQPGGLRLLGSF